MMKLINAAKKHLNCVYSCNYRELSASLKNKYTGHDIENKWHSVVGLEVHAQILSKSKLFSRVGTKYGAPPNTQVGVFEAAHPGTLPALNRRCVEAAIKTALALNSQVCKVSRFDRKHYFYPDLPAGYQITQSEYPIAKNGHIEFLVSNQHDGTVYKKSVGIIQIQLEEDSGKSLYDDTEHRVLVDLNRAGQPLMELVFAPELKDGFEAAALVQELCLILMRLKTCSCRMGEGALRVDANVSVHRAGEPFGTRTELKNLNSLKALVTAVEYEIKRHKSLLESGNFIVNETRGFDVDSQETFSMRDKETIQDYRFIPEPNLLPLRLYDSKEEDCSFTGCLDVNSIRGTLPELPRETRQKLLDKYHMNLQYLYMLIHNESLLEYFTTLMKIEEQDANAVCNLLCNGLCRISNSLNVDIEQCFVSPERFMQLVDMFTLQKIPFDVCVQVLDEMRTGPDVHPAQIVEEKNWYKETDEDYLVKICAEVMAQNPNLVNKVKSGKGKVINSLMGKVRQASNGKADMKRASEILMKKIMEEN